MRAPLTHWLLLIVLLLSPCALRAAPHKIELPLHKGELRLADLCAAVCREMDWSTRALDAGLVNLTGLQGSYWIDAVNKSLGDGIHLDLSGDRLQVCIDPAKFPLGCDAAKQATRIFTAIAAAEATAAQMNYYGIALPDRYDATRPLILLVHGLDSDRENWRSMRTLLTEAGLQSATFTYPSDQPLEDSAKFLAASIASLMAKYPAARLDIVAHSMGGLVVRAYLEGPAYAGRVSRFIMLGTPNHGSDWAKYRLLLEAREHYHLWKHEPTWRWTWMITDGLGEAARDLKPRSAFLENLNAAPRRSDVRYTIVAGARSEGRRYEAQCIAAPARLIPSFASGWWGLRQCKKSLQAKSVAVLEEQGDSDGPVRIESARLPGVSDFVLLGADHTSLYTSVGGRAPAAWAVVRDRLTH